MVRSNGDDGDEIGRDSGKVGCIDDVGGVIALDVTELDLRLGTRP